MKKIILLLIILCKNIHSAEKGPLTIFEHMKQMNTQDLNQQFIMSAKNWQSGEVIELLRNSKIDINTVDENQENALMHFSRIGDTKTMKFLLDKGARVNEQNQEGNTAATLACMHLKGQFLYNTLKLLKDYKADLTIPDKNGNSAATICKDFIKIHRL